MSAWLGLLLILIAGIALTVRSDVLIWGLDAEELAVAAASLALVLLVLPALAGGYRGRLGSAIRHVFAWLAIGLVLIAGYSYRAELHEVAFRIAGEFAVPGSTVAVEQGPSGDRSVRIRKRGDGHFVAKVTVNGATVPMLVDTGASTVVLRQADAERLGLDISRLSYTVPVQTANGLAYAAPLRLRKVAIGSITVSNIDALVAQPGALKESLLGMTFLSRLRSYEFAGDFLTFRN
jgi:aspartyl protease family protein